jgi:hypothetical protein
VESGTQVFVAGNQALAQRQEDPERLIEGSMNREA